jgi:hypothetical protein
MELVDTLDPTRRAIVLVWYTAAKRTLYTASLLLAVATPAYDHWAILPLWELVHL